MWRFRSPLLAAQRIIGVSSYETSRICEYDAVRRDGTSFKAMSLTPPVKEKQDPWFYRPGMKGQCYMFNSRKGIHTATTFPHETGSRESIEVRLALFKP